MAKPTEDAQDDLSLDIAEAVGKTIGNIVNRLNELDEERARLTNKLMEARRSVTEQFDKFLPAGFGASQATRAGRARGKREVKPGTKCTICNFATDPYHDGRLKAHRDQPEDHKKPLTADQLQAAGLRRL